MSFPLTSACGEDGLYQPAYAPSPRRVIQRAEPAALEATSRPLIAFRVASPHAPSRDAFPGAVDERAQRRDEAANGAGRQRAAED